MWWSVEKSRLLRFNISPSKERIKDFLLGFVQSTMSVRITSHNFLNLAHLQQVHLMGSSRVEHIVPYGKAKKGETQMVRDALAEHPGVKGLGGLSTTLIRHMQLLSAL